jgi:hypothetical protein
MIVYKLTDGFVSDLRYEDNSYVLRASEVKHADGFGTLPPLESMHDPVAVQLKEDAEEAERLRLANLKGDALAVEMLDRLRTATPTQISTYVDNNVLDIASARTMLKRILLVLALIAGGG